tara:strand:- start:174 stop:344 length:171 start_codon:yes stop_codon:yes gene_type:complete
MSKKLFIPPRQARLIKDEVDKLIDLIKKLDIGTMTQRQYMEEVDKFYKQTTENKDD